MPNYSIKFNNAGKVTLPAWSSGTGAFSVRTRFNTGDMAETDGLLGEAGGNPPPSFVAIYKLGKYFVRVGGETWVSSANGTLDVDTDYIIEVGRTSGTSCYVTVFESDGVTVVDTVAITSSAEYVLESAGFVGGALYFNSTIHELELTGGTQDRHYLSSVNTGTVWTDIISAQHGTLAGLATDGSEWVLQTGGAVDIEFAGTIPNFEYATGVVVNEDLSSYFTGSETPFTVANTGGNLTATGLTLNSNFTLTGTTNGGTASGVVVTGTDSATNTASSNAFNIVVNNGKTRAEIEAADTTGGLNPPFLLNDFDAGDLSTDEFTFTIDTQPTAGTLETTLFSTFKFTGAPNGRYSFVYTGYKNGVSYGQQTVYLSVGLVEVTITDINNSMPNGTYPVSVLDESTLSKIEDLDITFSSNSATFEIVAESGDEILIYNRGSNPPIAGNTAPYDGFCFITKVP